MPTRKEKARINAAIICENYNDEEKANYWKRYDEAEKLADERAAALKAERLKAKRIYDSQKIKCDYCDCVIRRDHMKRHQASKKCKLYDEKEKIWAVQSKKIEDLTSKLEEAQKQIEKQKAVINGLVTNMKKIQKRAFKEKKKDKKKD